jgi:hypothetical protein
VVLVDFLRANTDIFAWSPSDMPGILREVADHSLDILPYSRAVQQRLRRFDEEWRRAIGVELRKLLEAGFIKEVFHLTWQANLVLVKKKNGKWRMCVDYTGVGDSHEGPLKNRGESCLKPAKNAKRKHTSNLTQNIHTQHSPRRGGPHGPPERPSKAPC